MLVVEHNEFFHHWSQGYDVLPLAYDGDVVIAIDPSKTNFAMVVGTPTGTVIETIEFSGNNRTRGPVMDTTEYCAQLRAFLKVYLSRVHLYLVGVEAAITKQGVGYHHSNMVLTEIRGNLLNFFKEEFEVRVTEVNNWSWKSHCLPKGYRSRSEKGSKRLYLEQYPDSPYSHYYEADMTDCLCIYKFLVDTECKSYSTICNRIEECIIPYETLYIPLTWEHRNLFTEVEYNPNFSIDENVRYYVNRLLKPFLMQIPISLLSREEIYKHSKLFEVSNADDKNVYAFVRRL